ncbi:MAG: hypothetical protein NTY69_10775 [Methylococcales bacterium]|nr:hypothetical protein [Methylococcales bacterium]
MFWAFSLLVGLGFVFTKLGAYSVTVAILSGSLKLLVLLVIIAAMWLFFKNKPS